MMFFRRPGCILIRLTFGTKKLLGKRDCDEADIRSVGDGGLLCDGRAGADGWRTGCCGGFSGSSGGDV